MATVEQLFEALKEADRLAQSGDKNAAADAAKIAEMIRAKRAAGDTGNTEVDPAEARRQQVRDEYSKMSTIRQIGTAADDVVRQMADGATFGYADKLSAWLNSKMGDKSYEDNLAAERQATEDARSRAGLAGLASSVLGGGLTGGIAAKSGLTLAGRGVPEAAGLMRRLGTAAATGAAEGAVYGAIDATGHDTDVKQGAMYGGLFGGVANPLIEGAISAAAPFFPQVKAANAYPSLDELKAMKDAKYEAMDDVGAKFTGKAMYDMMRRMNSEVVDASMGARQSTAPKTLGTIESIWDDVAPGRRIGPPTSLYDIDQIRQKVSKRLIDSGDPTEATFGADIKRIIDETIDAADNSTVTTMKGNPEDAVNAIKEARKINQQKAKVSDLQDLLQTAARRVEKSETGLTSGGEIKNEVFKILEDPNKSLGYTPDEIKALEGVLKGTTVGNAGKAVANLTGGLSGRTAISGAGIALGNMFIPGYMGTSIGLAGGNLAAEAVRRAGKAMSERATEGQIQKLIGDISRGRPYTPPRAVPGVPDNAARGDIFRLLELMMLQDQSRQKETAN